MMYTLVWINEAALFFSIFVYTFTQLRREDFGRRMAVTAVVYAVIIMAVNAMLINEVIKADIYLRMFWYLMVVLVLKFCWEVKWSYAFYFGMWAFVSWQLLCGIWQQIMVIAHISISHTPFTAAAGNILVFAVGFAVASLTFAKWMTENVVKIGPRQLSSGILIFFIFELIAMAQRRLDISAGDSKWKLLYLAQVLIAVILYLQNELFRKSELRQELAIMNLLHKKDHEQYQLSKENIELINRKCHDLKHQIRAIRDMDKEDIDKYLEEIEQSVQIYEAVAKTGNEVLDTILTEKSLYCASNDITISCVADGKQLGFINTVDLYSLFGNALDNAIEAVEKFTEKEKRQIDVVIFKQQQFVVINILNPAPEKLEFSEDIPVTTKGDREYHGFGLKSMQHIVKKYDGFMNIKTEDGCFMLEILFPLKYTT